MEKINISKGFKIKLSGKPDASLIEIPKLDTVAVSALDIPYIRPKLLVKENEQVKTGSPLFCDKRDKSIKYVSPATGKIKNILFGQRRRLMEVIIECDNKDEFISFNPVSQSDLKKDAKEMLISHLKDGGLWQCFRQFPLKDTADANQRPAMIIVSLNGNDIFSPYPEVLLKNQEDLFEFGIEILKQFCPRIIITVRESHLENLGQIKKHVTHTVPDIFPSWDPGVVLYNIKKTSEENSSWCIAVEHLIMIAKFLSSGRYPFEKLITVTKSGEKNPHILTRQGAPIKVLAGKVDSNSLITTGQFNGRLANLNEHLGFFENTLNIIPFSDVDEMFGFIRPGFNSLSVSKTFLSCLKDTPMQVDGTLHGEERACINCSYCEKICPNDLMPNFIMKALYNDDIEEALQYGLLDCCRCGLCAYTCPSKIELTQILSNGMDNYYKDKA
ncbi:Na(+)-translocating NADH-quinone reductase subunit A [Candidatus Magnetomorum sp. HK-1]|nr:Na(+)-translocating NADH-quinone reductase subunit A [Candidatus Magnetomorum sp. HK-1]